MADVFFGKDLNRLFEGKKIVFVGDSNMRALYKDFIQLGINHVLIEQGSLRAKLEDSYNGDRLVYSGRKHNGRDIAEERVFDNGHFSAHFYFITKCFNDYVAKTMKDVVRDGAPNVIVYNSCIWDITRWGPKGVDVYKENIPKLMRLLRELLPRSTLFIWCTSLPISSKSRGGFLIQQVEFLKHTLRFDIMEANLYASKVVGDHGFDVLDLHYYLRHQIHRRAKDGIHWFPEPMRHITNLLLSHITLAWGAPLPNRFESRLLQSAVNMDYENGQTKVGNVPFDSHKPFHDDFTPDVTMNEKTPFFTAHAADLQRVQPSHNRQQQQFHSNPSDDRQQFNPFSVPQQRRRDPKCGRGRRGNNRKMPTGGSMSRGREFVQRPSPSRTVSRSCSRRKRN